MWWPWMTFVRSHSCLIKTLWNNFSCSSIAEFFSQRSICVVAVGIGFFDQELIPYHYASCSSSSCKADPRYKKAWRSVISNRIGMKFGSIVLQVNAHRVTEFDFWYDVILSRWRLWRRPSACWCICSSIRQLPASQPSACDVLGSVYTVQFLIYSTSHTCYG